MNNSENCPRKLSLLIGVTVSLIGLTVISGWLLGYDFLIKPLDGIAPVQFNTALSILLIGVSIALISFNKSPVSKYFSLIVFIIGFLTFLQFILGVEFQIDELFIKSHLNTSNLYPGRMAFNSSICFMLSGINLYLMTTKYKKYKIVLFNISGLFVIYLGTLGILNYFLDFTLNYGVGLFTRMSPITAVSFVLSGTAILILSCQIKKPEDFIPLSPLVAIFIVLLLTFLSWQYVNKNQDAYLKTAINTKLNNVSVLLQLYMEERINAFQRIGYRWVASDATSESLWRSDVKRYIEHQVGYKAIEWADKEFIIRWVEPIAGNEATIGFNLMQENNRRDEVQRALDTKKIQISTVVDLLQGGQGIILFDPVFIKSEFNGLIMGVIDTQSMIKDILAKINKKEFGVRITDGNRLIFSTHDIDDTYIANLNSQKSVMILDQTWNIIVWPSSKIYDTYKTNTAPNIIIIIGVFIAGLSGFLLTTLNLLKKGTNRLASIKRKLSESNGRLVGIIEGSRDLIAALDKNLNFMVFNTSYKTEVYRLFKVEIVPGMNFSVILNKMYEENRKKATELWKRALSGQSFSLIESFIDKRAELISYEIHYSPIYDDKKNIIGASHIASNITQRVNSENKMQESKKELENLVANLERQNKSLGWLKDMINLLQSCQNIQATKEPISTYVKKILHNTSGALYLTDKYNENSLTEIISWGRPKSELKNISKNECWGLLKSQTHYVNLVSSEENVMCKHINPENKPAAYGCLPMYAHGECLGLLYIETLPLTNTSAKQIISLAQIMSEQIALSLYNINLREELKNQSIHDSLTGIYNRRFFEEFLKKEIMKYQRNPVEFGLILVDIDSFKNINDSFGHLAGDEVLKNIAHKIQENCRKSDLLCRWGGEEFLILMHDNIDSIYSRANEIRETVETMELSFANTKLPRITVSMGIAVFPKHGHDYLTLTKSADEALYKAKTTGKNKVIIKD